MSKKNFGVFVKDGVTRVADAPSVAVELAWHGWVEVKPEAAKPTTERAATPHNVEKAAGPKTERATAGDGDKSEPSPRHSSHSRHSSSSK